MLWRILIAFKYTFIGALALVTGFVIAATIENQQIFAEMDREREAWEAEMRQAYEEIVQPEPAEDVTKMEPYEIIVTLAPEYGVNIDEAIYIADCESDFIADARNSLPGSTATGVYQWTYGTWLDIGSPGDRLNAYDNIVAFMEHYPTEPWRWTECLP